MLPKFLTLCSVIWTLIHHQSPLGYVLVGSPDWGCSPVGVVWAAYCVGDCCEGCLGGCRGDCAWGCFLRCYWSSSHLALVAPLVSAPLYSVCVCACVRACVCVCVCGIFTFKTIARIFDILKYEGWKMEVQKHKYGNRNTNVWRKAA